MLDREVVPLILVLNDEYWLPYCLESLAGFFKQMVIYDAGSTDRTSEIIRWFIDKEKHRTEFFVRFLPLLDPSIQGIFRNSMIAESRADTYFLVDGDEIYNPEDLNKVKYLGNKLFQAHEWDHRKKFGLFRRTELTYDLRSKYTIEREHHRLYHRTAIWRGTHPGERSFYKQNLKSEMDFKSEVNCWHFHNALRSSQEKKTPERLSRKSQKSYHPGDTKQFNLLEEVPILRNQIENFEPCPTLKELWNG
jgi:glycosyltransferase involved in cell wall biosynthesis